VPFVTKPPEVREVYIVVDVEASGPNPGDYALLSIGACTVDEPRHTFYVELQPDKAAFTAEAMAVCGLSLERLAAEGLPPEEAMQAFAGWVAEVVPDDARAVLAAFNAPFDWMFINDYFHRYLGHNPFGHSALDIKAYYMGLEGVNWQETAHRYVSQRYSGKPELTHHALDDALAEAEILEAMMSQRGTGCEEEAR
jgi:DNA polymerase III epsilon subunit-like protein